MPQRQQMDATGATLLIVFSALLGLNQALVKLVNDGLAPVFQGGLRSICAVVVVTLWMAWRGKTFNFKPDIALFGLINGLLFAFEFAFLFLALDYSTVARSSLLFYTMPFFVALGAHFMFPGERLTWLRSAGLVVASAGVAMVVAIDIKPAGENTLLGDVCALAAALCWAAITLLTRASRLSSISPEMNLLYCLLVSGPVLLLLAPLFGDSVREVTPLIVAVFSFQVIIIVSLGFIVWLWVLSVYPVSDMASFSLLTPLFGVFFGWLMFSETLTPVFVFALVLVCGGLFMVNRRPQHRCSNRGE